MQAAKNLPIWTPLASLALALAWLLPNASPPWLAFHKDAWIAGAIGMVLVVMVWKTRRQVGLPATVTPLVFVLLMLAGLTFSQWVFGQIFFLGHALLGTAYFLAAALSVALAQRWEAAEPNAVGDFFFAAVLIAALATTGFMLAQWLQLSQWEVWIQPVPIGRRPYGNLIQPNHAASVLVLAMISLLWWVYRGKLGTAVALLGASYLSVFVAMTGSRIGLLSLFSVVVTVLVMVLRSRQRGAWTWVLLTQMVWIPLCAVLLSWDWGPNVSIGTGPSGALQRELAGARQQVYVGYLNAVWDRPWLGYGFAQSVSAQAYLREIGITLPGLFTWAHNAFLDLALWFGLPLSILAVVALAFTVWRLMSAPQSTARWIYMAGVLVIFLHGMVELPLAYAYFLLPIALLTGAAQVGVRLPGVTIALRVVMGVLLSMCLYLAVLWYDYLRVEHAFNIWRFKHSNIGTYHPKKIPNTLVLDQFEALLTGLRAEGALDPRALRGFQEAVLLHPSASALQQLAEVQVRSGQVQAAQQTADLAWLLSLPDVRKALARRWQYLASVNPAYTAVTWRED
jgi:hypothetical protein